MSKAFTAEFKLEAAKLLPDQNYTHEEAAKAMNVSLSAVNRWVKSLRMERQGKTHPGLPLTSEQPEVREMRKRRQRPEMDNEILKKATALLMPDSLNSSR
jgi:transposase-like protein